MHHRKAVKEVLQTYNGYEKHEGGAAGMGKYLKRSDVAIWRTMAIESKQIMC